MSRLTVRLTLFVLMLCLTLTLSIRSLSAQSATLTLLTINDVYELTPAQGQGGLAELYTLLQAERATATQHLTTVNGDFLSPSIMSGLFKGAQMIALFNALQVDMVVFGNHEFDFGPEVTRQRIAESRFPWLGSNVLGTDGQPFGGAVATLLRQVGPFKVGFFGVLTPETAHLSSPGTTVTFAPVIPSASAAVTALRQAGAEVIIALTHLNFAEDRALAQQVPGISLILGGHEHDPITWYEGGTLIHKSGSDAHYLGRIDLHLEKQVTAQGSHLTVTPTWRMIANRGVPPDPAILGEIRRYTQALDQELSQPLGTTSTPLSSQSTETRSQENTMGNLITNALREALVADVALINGGGIRGDRLYAAETTLTRRDVLTELPFGNVGVLLDLSGADLRAALEHGVSQSADKAGRFPQVAGLRLAYDPRQPAGSRVLEVMIGGKPLEPQARYRVATSDYLLRGGDGYRSLSHGTVLVDARAGTLLTSIVADYIARHGTLAVQREGRIVVRQK
ncbi:MAG: bifunctional UDP-sugar hydrolase/5'-nucleotidase [Candidatus Tectimicrobiota bacterium]